MTGPRRTRLVGRLASVVGSRHWFWVLPLIGVGLVAPGLGSGWIADDHFHRAALVAGLTHALDYQRSHWHGRPPGSILQMLNNPHLRRSL